MEQQLKIMRGRIMLIDGTVKIMRGRIMLIDGIAVKNYERENYANRKK